MVNQILAEVRLTYYGDAFGTVQSWRFALCDYLLHRFGWHVPHFRPSIFGPETDDFYFVTLANMGVTQEECIYALEILDRARNIMRVEGLDY